MSWSVPDLRLLPASPVSRALPIGACTRPNPPGIPSNLTSCFKGPWRARSGAPSSAPHIFLTLCFSKIFSANNVYKHLASFSSFLCFSVIYSLAAIAKERSSTSKGFSALIFHCMKLKIHSAERADNSIQKFAYGVMITITSRDQGSFFRSGSVPQRAFALREAIFWIFCAWFPQSAR